MATQLSNAQCILLAVNLASESQISALAHLHHIRLDSLPPELVFRILLTYLPTVIPPAQYTDLVESLAGPQDREQTDDGSLIDTSSVDGISNAAADKKLRKLTLLPLAPPSYSVHGADDALTKFIIHRAYRIDEETGLIALCHELVLPFLAKSESLGQWYLSVLLPLFRLRNEYYPNSGIASDISLEQFERLNGRRGLDLLLSGAKNTDHEIVSGYDSTGTIGRDLRGLVGPWLYGNLARRRGDASIEVNGTKVEEQGTAEDQDGDHSWDMVFEWMVCTAEFERATSAIEHWDGPEDVDLGPVEDSYQLEQTERDRLRRRYAQTAFAICYAVEQDTMAAIEAAHGILVRLASLLDFEPPPDLATSVEQLPAVDRHLTDLYKAETLTILQPQNLMQEDHCLTASALPSYMLLQMLVYSAYQLAGLQHRTSIVNVAKLRFFSTMEEQLKLVQRILREVSRNGKRDDQQWVADRGRLLWLWNWNIDPEEGALRGSGPLGDISRDVLEKEILTAMLSTGNLSLVKQIYLLSSDANHRLDHEELEATILAEALRCYDTASNGNRTRGSMKKACDIINTFSPNFPQSVGFQRASALILATHSMSFYTLILQYGVPFQPINIRVSSDPLVLLEQILEQNAKSYTKLDDLIYIGRNLALSRPPPVVASKEDRTLDEASSIAQQAERRVILMCISSALQNHDFDTAYSYLINRLSPSSSLTTSPHEQTDDTSWRAALLAGRYRPPATAHPDLNAQIRLLEQRTELLSLALRLAPVSALTEILNVYRRCEEEMNSLNSQRAEQEEAHDDILSRQRGGGDAPDTIPGGFGGLGVHEGRTFGQERREMGRLAAAPAQTQSKSSSRSADPGRGREGEEAPVGLFDLASGAAAALRRNAFPLRSGSGSSSLRSGRVGPEAAPSPVVGGHHHHQAEEEEDEKEDDWGADWGDADTPAPASAKPARPQRVEGEGEDDAWGWNDDSGQAEAEDDEGAEWGSGSFDAGPPTRTSGDRVRKRDVVANAVTGSLASGIGWVLGATPVNNDEEKRRREAGH